MKTDSITLKNALETDLWKMVYVGEPNRKIEVTMTYADLLWITKTIEEVKSEAGGQNDG